MSQQIIHCISQRLIEIAYKSDFYRVRLRGNYILSVEKVIGDSQLTRHVVFQDLAEEVKQRLLREIVKEL